MTVGITMNLNKHEIIIIIYSRNRFDLKLTSGFVVCACRALCVHAVWWLVRRHFSARLTRFAISKAVPCQCMTAW